MLLFRNEVPKISVVRVILCLRSRHEWHAIGSFEGIGALGLKFGAILFLTCIVNIVVPAEENKFTKTASFLHAGLLSAQSVGKAASRVRISLIFTHS